MRKKIIITAIIALGIITPGSLLLVRANTDAHTQDVYIEYIEHYKVPQRLIITDSYTKILHSGEKYRDFTKGKQSFNWLYMAGNPPLPLAKYSEVPPIKAGTVTSVYRLAGYSIIGRDIKDSQSLSGATTVYFGELDRRILPVYALEGN